MRRRRKRKYPTSSVAEGYIDGFGPSGRLGSDPFSDSLRAAGIVEDRDVRGLAAHKRRVRQRRGRLPQALRDGLAAVGIPLHDHNAAAAELAQLDGGYTFDPEKPR